MTTEQPIVPTVKTVKELPLLPANTVLCLSDDNTRYEVYSKSSFIKISYTVKEVLYCPEFFAKELGTDIEGFPFYEDDMIYQYKKGNWESITAKQYNISSDYYYAKSEYILKNPDIQLALELEMIGKKLKIGIEENEYTVKGFIETPTVTFVTFKENSITIHLRKILEQLENSEVFYAKKLKELLENYIEYTKHKVFLPTYSFFSIRVIDGKVETCLADPKAVFKFSQEQDALYFIERNKNLILDINKKYYLL